MTPTPEQSSILDVVESTSDNLMIRARAGCGKTSTLAMIDATGTSTVPHLLVCFNKAIATEAQKKVREITTVRTFNSLGHRIWADFTAKKLTLSKTKIRDIFKSIADEATKGERSYLWSQYDQILSAVNFARALGYIPSVHAKAPSSLCSFSSIERLLDETASPDVRDLVDRILNLSIAQAYRGIIDFTDQVYMPALFGGNYPRFPLVMIDEYQDLSPTNRAMVGKLCRRSRQIGVGDEAQSIYGFRGADRGSMQRAVDDFGMQTLPLSTSFRCPSAITRNVHWHVADIRSANEGGSISFGSGSNFKSDSAVICRYNAPLIALAISHLLSGHRVNMDGVDIGQKIIRQLQRLGPPELTSAQALSALADWQAERESNDSKSAKDLAECMRHFLRQTKSLDGAITYANHLFASSSGDIKFMSGHASKGLEFDHVYHLNHDRIDRTSTEEANIHYVIDTRASQSLTYIHH